MFSVLCLQKQNQRKEMFYHTFINMRLIRLHDLRVSEPMEKFCKPYQTQARKATFLAYVYIS